MTAAETWLGWLRRRAQQACHTVAVRCSAWLDAVGSDSELSAPVVVLGLIACIGIVVPGVVCAVMCSSLHEAWWVLWRCWACMLGCGVLAFLCALIELRFAVARADRERERRRREDESNPGNDGSAQEVTNPSASLKLKLGAGALVGISAVDDGPAKNFVSLESLRSVAAREEDAANNAVSEPMKNLEHE